MFDDDKKHQAGSVWNKYGVAPTLDTCQGGLRQVCIVDNNRIRKLPPKEYFRLMGVSDKKFQRIVDIGLSDSQLYKLAGNSIVQQVLENIFSVFFNKNIK